jgi:trehalose 6-phosphate phosphatase
VAVITGRACRDARAHLGFAPRYLVGNHGAEGVPGGEAREAGFVRLCRQWDRQLRGLLPEAGHAGILRENKGASLSFHYRGAPDRAAAHRVILEAIGRLEPRARRVPGHFVENALPREAPDKGDALLALMAHSACHKALFVGDDRTDEDVFRRKDPRILGIRVGFGTPSDACLRLRNQDEVGRLVDEILSVLEGEPGTALEQGK